MLHLENACGEDSQVCATEGVANNNTGPNVENMTPSNSERLLRTDDTYYSPCTIALAHRVELFQRVADRLG